MTWIKDNKIVFALLVVCIGFGIYFIYEAVKWVPYPNQMDYGEGLVMYINKMWANGTWKWDMTIPPYLPLMYGIIMPLLNIPLIKEFGAELWTGRLIMALSAVGTSVMMYLILYRLTKSKVWSIIGALLPFTQPIIRDWALQARVDMLAVMFDMIAFYLVIRFKDSKHIYWSIIPFMLAILTKATSTAALFALLAYLLIQNRKVLWRYLAIFLPIVIVTFIALQVWSGGEYINHISLYNRTKDMIWTMAVIETNIATLMQPLAVFFILAMLYICGAFNEWGIKLGKLNLVGWFFICAFIIDFVSGLRPGGFINYYLEFICATCICATLVFPLVIKKATNKYKEDKSIGAYALLLGAMLVLLVVESPQSAIIYPNEQYDRDVKVVTEIIQDTDQPVITENSGLVLHAGKEIYAEFFMLTNMTVLGTWDDTNYLNDYKNQKFDYIILRVPLYNRPENGDGHFPKNIMDAIKENYTLIYDPPTNLYYWYSLPTYESNKKFATDTRFNPEAR